ncbi:Nuclear envelope morphology protein 1 [Gryganskiella cystojenkinii]|nr:Nuclear envelope morphology protein 1 [Gryganskiella cystojenkinii]
MSSSINSELHHRGNIRLSLPALNHSVTLPTLTSPSSIPSSPTSTPPSSAPTTPSTTFQKSAPASLSVALCRSLVIKYIYMTYLFLCQLLTLPSAAFQKFIRQRSLFGGKFGGGGRVSNNNSNIKDDPMTRASAAGSGIGRQDDNNSATAEAGEGTGQAVVIGAGAEKFLQQYTLDNHLGQYNNINNSNNRNSNNNDSSNNNNGASMLRRSSRFKSRSDLEEIAQASSSTTTTGSSSSSSIRTEINRRSGTGNTGYGTDSMAEEGSGDNSTTPRGNSSVRLRQRTVRPMSSLGVPGPHGHGPGMGTRKKTLVLDLDETLIHSTSRGSRSQGYMVEVLVDRHACLYYVYKRPHVDYFLKKVSEWYKLVIFTASMAEYADPVIDWLDQNKTLFEKRYFRQACFLRNGSYLKDLTVIDPDLSSVCLLDNSPMSYSLNKENGIPIDSWIDDPNDEALLDLLPFLDALRFTEDVRSVLSLRTV